MGSEMADLFWRGTPEGISTASSIASREPGSDCRSRNRRRRNDPHQRPIILSRCCHERSRMISAFCVRDTAITASSPAKRQRATRPKQRTKGNASSILIRMSHCGRGTAALR